MYDFNLFLFAGVIATLVIAIYRWPSVAIAPFLCMFGLEQWIQTHSVFMLAHPTLANFIAASLVFYAVALRCVRSEINTRAIGPVFILVLALFGFSLATTLWSVHTDFVGERWSLAWPFILTGIVAAPWVVAHPRDLQPAMLATYILGAFTVTAILFSGAWVEGSRHLHFADGETRGNPLALAEVAGYTAIIGTLVVFPCMSRTFTVARWVTVAIASCVTVLSGSRGQFFGCIATLVCFLPLANVSSRRGSLGRLVIGLGLLLAISYYAFSIHNGGSGRWDLSTMKSVVTETRVARCQEILSFWMNGSVLELLLGLGTCSSFELIGWYPHCVPAEVLAEEGLIGFSLYLGIVVLSIHYIRVASRCIQEPTVQRASIVVGALLAYLTILSLKQGSLLSTYGLCLLAIILERSILSGFAERAPRGRMGIRGVNSHVVSSPSAGRGEGAVG